MAHIDTMYLCWYILCGFGCDMTDGVVLITFVISCFY